MTAILLCVILIAILALPVMAALKSKRPVLKIILWIAAAFIGLFVVWLAFMVLVVGPGMKKW